MAFNYNKLRGKIKEMCGTQKKFAKLLGISRTSLSQRLNNTLDFSNTEILRACEILNININDIPSYFFNSEVQKHEPQEAIKLNDLIAMITEKNGQPITSSRKVAEVFEREHFHVIRNIENLTDSTSGLSEEFRLGNFAESKYKDNSGKWNKEYLLTKDGFTMVAMEFKTKRARLFKEEYIKQFNRMESFIKSLQQVKLEFPAFTDAIMQAHEEPKHYHFSNEINMINRIVLGMSASQFKDSQGIDKKVSSIRPYLKVEQIQKIEELQRVDIGLIVAGLEFEIRKQILTNYLNKKYLLAS